MARKPKEPTISDGERVYEYYMFGSAEDLESHYNSWLPGYPRGMCSLIKCVADLRGIDTSKWKPFRRY